MLKTFIKKWLIPTGFFDIARRIKSLDKKTYFSTELFLSNKKFKNLHLGERCFILASGPSIRSQDLSAIFGETCIAVSHFHLHPLIDQIKPKYHVLAPQHAPFSFSDSSKYFEDFIPNYLNFKSEIFLGLTPYEYNYQELLKQKPNYNSLNLNYLDYSASKAIDETNFLKDEIWDITKNPFSIRTVLYAAIQLAVYMGFKEIYLLGADHDYINDTARTTNHHFYEEKKGISDKEHLESFNTERWFEEYYFRWKQYRLMKEYCNTKDINIYNATEGGMLDVFERRRLKDLK